MPGWHDATKELQAEGRIQTVGIVQEQHPSRTRLFMQWQEMEWPVMVDSLNLLGLNVVPVTLLIDEAGVIRFKGSEENLVKFLALDPPAPRPKPHEVEASSPPERSPSAAGATRDLLHHGDQVFLWGGPERIDEVIATYGQALASAKMDDPLRGVAHFRLGVAYRQRADSQTRQDGDFRHAIDHWGEALASDPNQYIWRRRIQQYGPRLEKPYSFYDWVSQARREITERGGQPIALDVEPRGAELANPSREFSAAADQTTEPPIGAHRIFRDEKGLIRLETTLVPKRITPGSAARVHLSFRPNKAVRGHWNNEADDMEIWLEAPEGWQLDQRRLTTPNPPDLVSEEERLFELEVKSPEDARRTTLEGFALYYVCEDINGTCLYRRQDFSVDLKLTTDQDGGEDWVTFRGDNRRQGHSGERHGAVEEPVRLWRFDTGARVESSPTLWQDRLFVGSFSGNLYALERESGRELWRYGTDSLVRASPSVVDGVVFFGADDNKLHAVDARSGELRWAFEFGPGGEQSSPAVVDGTVYFGAFDESVYALDAATGEKRWSYHAGGGMLSSPAIAEGRLFIGVMDGTVHAVNLENGEKAWSFKAGDKPIFASPAIADDMLFVGAYDSFLYALRLDDGSLVWKKELGGNIFSSAALADGKVFIGAADGFYAVDQKTGETHWKSREATGSVFGSAAISEERNRIYIGTSDMGVLIYSLAGELVDRLEIGDKVWSSVSVGADGHLFFGSHDGHIYAYGAAGERSP